MSGAAPWQSSEVTTRRRLGEIGEACDCLGDVECLLERCRFEEEGGARWALDGAGRDRGAVAPETAAEPYWDDAGASGT